MMEPLIHYVLIFLTLMFALVAVEVKKLVYSILSFFMVSVCLGLLFWSLGAPWVALFQLMVYAGAITVLFLATINLTREGMEAYEDE
ncbi:MAG: NADH-quinone oxidoreductase subunit J [Candidatus Odinarchaeota archaeon]|nr:NADH-quinone oxidoreductase subunit J [Candidatus Odinarchaeota archaeon]